MQIIPLETNVSHVTKRDRTLPASAFVVNKHRDEPPSLPSLCLGVSQEKCLEGKAITLRADASEPKSRLQGLTTFPATNKLRLGPTAASHWYHLILPACLRCR